jgi:hypothetical protein
VSRATPLLSLDDEAPEVALGNDTPEFAGFFRVDQRPRGRDVRIFAQLRNKVIVTGDTIPAKAITEILLARGVPSHACGQARHVPGVAQCAPLRSRPRQAVGHASVAGGGLRPRFQRYKSV